ncbi:hypothetical protein GOV13_02675 [Candidatus Pacearchaeota archaeon]|nr:hypothetical protein [Candidatus Pacearchaeota archaeon]
MGIEREMKDFKSLEEFRKWAKKNSYNIVEKWDKKQFGLVCQNCCSEKVMLLNNLEVDYSGCETCGSWMEKEGAIIVKCLNCSSAMTILKGEDDIE